MLQVQNNKQLLSSYAKKTHDRNVAPYRIPDQESSKINPKWTQEEQLLGVQGKNDTYLCTTYICLMRKNRLTYVFAKTQIIKYGKNNWGKPCNFH